MNKKSFSHCIYGCDECKICPKERYILELKMKSNLTKRNNEILKMRQDRYKLREIAEKYNITKERVRQITSKENA